MTETIIKEAAQRLLDKKEITQEEHDVLTKMAAKVSKFNFASLKKFLTGKKTLMDKFKDLSFDPGFKFKTNWKTIKDPAGKGGFSQKAEPSFEFAPTFSAKPKRTLGQNLKGIASPLAAAAVATVVGKEAIVDPISRRMKVKRSFDSMVNMVPQLAEKDQDELRDYFNVIKTFSPKTATNPLVAGHLVNKMIEFGGVDHKLVQDIAAIEMGLATPKVTQTVLEAGAKSIAGAPGE